jgi:outer membrane protein TolC
MKHSVAINLIILLLLSNPVRADYLRDLIVEALNNNPKIQALKNEWESKKAKITAEKWRLPNTEGIFNYFGEPIQTKTGPQDFRIGLKQMVPFPTKLSLYGKIAAKRASIAAAKYEIGLREVIRDIKIFFYDYYFILESLRILEEEKTILDNMRKTVQRKYEGLGYIQNG